MRRELLQLQLLASALNVALTSLRCVPRG